MITHKDILEYINKLEDVRFPMTSAKNWEHWLEIREFFDQAIILTLKEDGWSSVLELTTSLINNGHPCQNPAGKGLEFQLNRLVREGRIQSKQEKNITYYGVVKNDKT